MNNYRRKILSNAETVLDTIHGEIELLASEEEQGNKESDGRRISRVKGWQGKLEGIQSEVEGIKDEEADAAENTRGEEKKEQMEAAVTEMEELLEDVEELVALDPLANFCEAWHSKYDSMISNIQTASE